jgi:hypothetical protein
MPDTPSPRSWLLPVLLSISTTAALAFAFLYLFRPNAGELGAIRVVVTDDNGKSGNGIRVVVAEAPLVQKDTINPGPQISDMVYYPSPYRIRPNLKLTCGKRHYDILAQTEYGFTWAVRLRPEDCREPPKEDNPLDKFLADPELMATLRGNLKPGLVFEEFTWQAEGLRAPLSAIPPKVQEQTGTFRTLAGQEATQHFPLAFISAPHVELSGPNSQSTIVVDSTSTGFKWRNVEKDSNRAWQGEVTWKAKGVLAAGEAK